MFSNPKTVTWHFLRNDLIPLSIQINVQFGNGIKKRIKKGSITIEETDSSTAKESKDSAVIEHYFGDHLLMHFNP